MPIWHFKFYVSSALMSQITTSIIFDTLIIPNDNFFTISNPKRKRAILRTAHHLYKFFANDFRSATIWGFVRSFCNISCSSCGATGDASWMIPPQPLEQPCSGKIVLQISEHLFSCPRLYMRIHISNHFDLCVTRAALH